MPMDGLPMGKVRVHWPPFAIAANLDLPGLNTGIKLPSQNLVSSIPSEFGLLTELQELDLSDNAHIVWIHPTKNHKSFQLRSLLIV